MSEPNRRSFLRWAIHGLGALFAVVLGAPAVAYLIDARNRKASTAEFKTVARLSDLVDVDRPYEVPIRETRRDAWTLQRDAVIGRAFLINHGGGKVTAFTTICPHLGCSINYTPGGEATFTCPCHNAHYGLNGQREGLAHNPAKRGMDTLEVRMDPEDPDAVQVKYQFFVQGQPEKIIRG
jgi:Rieske Fe-S protein